MSAFELYALRQVHIDWLLKMGVSAETIILPDPIELVRGSRGQDGIFEHSPDGPEWFAFLEDGDMVYWRPKTGELATEHGAAFALGGDDIRNPGVTALGRWLYVRADPLEWLRSCRRGAVVIRWDWAFEQLRDVQRIAVPEDLVETYLQSMKPPRMPEIGVVPHVRKVLAA